MPYRPYLAHVLRAQAATVGRGRGVVERRDPEPAVGVDARRVRADLGEAAEHAVVRQDGLDEEGVSVADHLQVAPAAAAAAPRINPKRQNATARVRNSWAWVGRGGRRTLTLPPS
jgi:hypothetical protein